MAKWNAVWLLLATVCATQAEPPTPDQAIERLQVGHARFLCGKADHPNTTSDARRTAFSEGQHPFATILACSDSRVPVERIFDQGFGDLFVIRVAGNVTAPHQAGSIEYAVEHLHTPLLVVLGHRGCGAVKAALETPDAAGHGNIGSIVQAIAPSTAQARNANPRMSSEQLWGEAVKANVANVMDELMRSSPIIQEAVRGGHLRVVGAVYDIESGALTWLPNAPATAVAEATPHEPAAPAERSAGSKVEKTAGVQVTRPPLGVGNKKAPEGKHASNADSADSKSAAGHP